MTSRWPTSPSRGVRTAVLRFPDQYGNPLELVAPGEPITISGLLSNQLACYRQMSHRTVSSDIVRSLEHLMTKAKEAGVSWVAVLADRS